MATKKKTGTINKVKAEIPHIADELEVQFHQLQAEIGKARDTYLTKKRGGGKND